MKITSNNKIVKASCGKKGSGCFITLMPVLIVKERLQEFKKAA
jgi:hypothetical protein